MEDSKAKKLLSAERRRVEGLLTGIDEAGVDDRVAADQEGEMYDSAEPLTTEGTDDAVRAELEDRLAAVGRAEQRLAAGTYGVSVRSGEPIPDDATRSGSDHRAHGRGGRRAAGSQPSFVGSPCSALGRPRRQ